MGSWPPAVLIGDSQTQLGWQEGGWVVGLADHFQRRVSVAFQFDPMILNAPRLISWIEASLGTTQGCCLRCCQIFFQKKIGWKQRQWLFLLAAMMQAFQRPILSRWDFEPKIFLILVLIGCASWGVWGESVEDCGISAQSGCEERSSGSGEELTRVEWLYHVLAFFRSLLLLCCLMFGLHTWTVSLGQLKWKRYCTMWFLKVLNRLTARVKHWPRAWPKKLGRLQKGWLIVVQANWLDFQKGWEQLLSTCTQL